MTAFWLGGAALAALALALLLRPLFARQPAEGVSRRGINLAIHRDQLRELDADLAAGLVSEEDYQRSRRELEARALDDAVEDERRERRGARVAALVAAVLVPAGAAGLYLAVGSHGAFNEQQFVDRMVDGLAARLQKDPSDVEGWKMLGRSYAALERYDRAADAYARAAVLAPRDAQLLADFADVLAMAKGGLQGDPESLVKRALELDPQNAKALALAGTAAFHRRDFAAAAGYWERMVPLVPADSEDARIVRENLAEARKLAGAAGKGVRGTVALSPKLKGAVKPDDTVFIFARAAEGPPMPLAAMKVRVSDLPAAFSLDDTMAMAPGLAVSAFPRVVITARVSRSGSPAPQTGDAQGSSRPVANDATGVKILIDSVVP